MCATLIILKDHNDFYNSGIRLAGIYNSVFIAFFMKKNINVVISTIVYVLFNYFPNLKKYLCVLDRR